MNQYTAKSPHAAARYICKNNLPALLGHTLVQLLVRAIAFAPFIATFFGVTYGVQDKLASAAGFGLSFPLYLLIVLPMRFMMRGALLRMAKSETDKAPLRYAAWLRFGLMRSFRALPWILPLLICIGGFYYLWNIAEATLLPRVIRGAGELVGGTYTHGLILLTLACILSAVLCFIGWRHHLALEFLPVHTLANKDAFVRSRTLMQSQRALLAHATRVNFVIALPAVVAVLILLSIDLSGRLTGSLQFDAVIILEAVTKLKFTQNTLYLCAAALLILYVPLVPYRKAALAACLAVADKQHG